MVRKLHQRRACDEAVLGLGRRAFHFFMPYSKTLPVPFNKGNSVPNSRYKGLTRGWLEGLGGSLVLTPHDGKIPRHSSCRTHRNRGFEMHPHRTDFLRRTQDNPEVP